MSALRKRLIRLAHANPELRQHLVPLLRKAKSDLQVEVRNALKAVQRPWKAVLVKSNQKDTVVGTDWLFSVSIQPPRERTGPSLAPTRLSPVFKFYVTEVKKGPRAGTFYFQSTIGFIGKDERLHRPMELRNAKEVGNQIARLLSDNAYKQITY